MDTPTTLPAATAHPAVDDFAEFLTTTYTPYLTACHDRGWNTEFVFSLSGYALRICDAYSGPVDVTDDNRPLPASPADAERWLLSSSVGVAWIPADASVSEWANTIDVLMRAGR